jgi:hypothetical protein
MILRNLNESELEAYDALARSHGTLFNRLEWISLFAGRMQPLGLFEDGGQMVGGVSLFRERRLGLTVFRRAPFTPTCGPFIEVKAQNPVTVLEVHRKALDCLIDYLEGHPRNLTMLPLDQRISDAMPFLWRGYKVVPKYTYLIDLSLSREQIIKNMSSIRRNDISKATRDGLVVQPTTDMGVVRDLVLATFGRQQKGIDRECLEAILFRYAKPVNSYAISTYRRGKPIATCFVVHDAQTAYYLLGGYDAQDRHHGAGALAVVEAILRAQELRLKTFDFEGSSIPPIEKYFRGFGGRLIAYYTVNRAWLPLEMLLKLRNREFF